MISPRACAKPTQSRTGCHQSKAGRAIMLKTDPGLKEQQFRLKTDGSILTMLVHDAEVPALWLLPAGENQRLQLRRRRASPTLTVPSCAAHKTIWRAGLAKSHCREGPSGGRLRWIQSGPMRASLFFERCGVLPRQQGDSHHETIHFIDPPIGDKPLKIPGRVVIASAGR
jgi:hypothetical protein